MSLLPIIVIVILIIIISMGFLILTMKSDKRNKKNKPYLFSQLALVLMILNGVIYLTVLYFTDFSVVIRFAPTWFIVSIIALFSAYKEYNHNRIFAVAVAGLALISSIVGMIFWSLGNL